MPYFFKSFLLFSLFSGISIADSKKSSDCSKSLTSLNTLEDYVNDSAYLPKQFNILELRGFQHRQGLPLYTPLADRFKNSFSTIYGKKGSNQIETALGSAIAKELGRGWMARVVQLEDGRVFKIIIRERGRTSNVGILFETEAWLTYFLDKNKSKYKINVLPILSVGPDGMFLEKPYVNPKTIGSHILKSKKRLTKDQKNQLLLLFERAVFLAQETGISLDLKSDNMFWNGEAWVLFDPIGSITYKAYSRTLDAKDFNDFLLRWSDSGSVDDNGLRIDDVIRLFPDIGH